MIHITDKLYITYAESSLSPSDENRVTEAFIQIIDKNLSVISFPAYDAKRLHHTKTIDELIHKYESDQLFFEGCKDIVISGRTPKVVIYADENSFTEFLVRWWKGLFPSITVNGAFALYRLFGDSESLRNKNRANFLSFTGVAQDGLFDNVMKLYWGKTKEEFSIVFNAASGFKVDASIKKSCSIEYHLMNYMLDSEYSEKSYLLEKVKSLFNKKLMKEIYYMKETIEEGLYALAATETLLADNALFNENSIAVSVKKNAKLLFILDDNINESKAGYEHVEKNYNLPKFAFNLLTLDNQINKHLLNSEKSVEIDNPCLDYISKERRTPEATELLEMEVEGLGKSHFKLLDILIKKNRLNPYIIPAMKKSIELDLPIVQEFKF